MSYKAFVAFDKLAAADVNTYLMNQSVMAFSALAAGTAAIGASVTEGMTIYDQATNIYSSYDGSSWIPMVSTTGWTTWTPSLTGFNAGTGGTITAKYTQVGKTVHFVIKVVFGSSGYTVSDPKFSMPVTPNSTNSTYGALGAAVYMRATAQYGGFTWINGSTINPRVFVTGTGTTGNLSTTSPATWASGDIWSFNGTYEAA